MMQRIMDVMQQVLTIEQFDAMTDYYQSLSDQEFDQLMAEALHIGKSQEQLTPREFTKLIETLRKANHITSQNSAMRRVPITYLSDTLNEEMWRDICKSQPSDTIHLTTKDDQALCDLWKKSCHLERGRIPSDLFFAGKIPLLDCKIVVDERDMPGGVVCQYRVVVFQDYKERIKESGECEACVAAIVIEKGKYTAFFPIVVQEGMDMICMGRCGQHGMPRGLIEKNREMVSVQDVANMIYAYMATWYGIQVALLHPTVQEVFRHPRIERVYDPKSVKKGKTKRVTRYVKKHIVNADEIKRAAHGEGKAYNRHTLVWYVIGHWRKCSNGKKIFIQPYWKGALRHLKMDLDGREREIVLHKEDE